MLLTTQKISKNEKRKGFIETVINSRKYEIYRLCNVKTAK